MLIAFVVLPAVSVGIGLWAAARAQLPDYLSPAAACRST
jgi:hypothetical protein